MKKLVLVAVISLFVFGITLGFVGSNEIENGNVSLDFADTGFAEYEELDFADTGFAEYEELDFADTGFAEYEELDFADTGFAEYEEL